MRAPVTYLDHNATSPVDSRVHEQMVRFESQPHANSRSAHPAGREVAKAISHARDQVADCLGCHPDEVIFTSGGTEANNLAIKGLAWARELPIGLAHLAVEHYSVTRSMAFLSARSHRLDVISVNAQGLLDSDSLTSVLQQRPGLVAIQHANNEVGTIQDIARHAAAVQEAGGLMLVDAAQSVGKLTLDVHRDGIDFLTGSAHKFGGPGGIGFLVKRREVAIEPLQHGAGHEDGLRSGTHAAALIVGLGAACELARLDRESDAARMADCRDRLQQLLLDSLPGLVVNGHPVLRLPHTLNVSLPGVIGLNWLLATPSVAATTGAACHSDRVEPSAVMKALGVPLEVAAGAIRLSLGRSTSLADIDHAARHLIEAGRTLLSESRK